MKPLIYISNDVSVNYPSALTKNGFDFTFTDVEFCDGLCIPGGGDVTPCLYNSPRTDVTSDLALDIKELYLIRKFLSKNKPVLGICRGLQVINTCFGGTLRDYSHSDNGGDIAVSCYFYGDFNKVFGEKGAVKCNHRQAIDALGEGLTVAARSFDGVIEAVCAEKLIATQFHPERTFGENVVCGDEVFKLFGKFFRQ